MGVICRSGGAPDVAVSATVTLPPLLFTPSEAENVPLVVGANVTVTVTDAPATSVAPDTGTPVDENGAAGPVELPNVSVWVPVFCKTTERDFDVPVATPPKLTVAGVATSWGPSTCPVPVSVTSAVPAEVVTVRLAEAAPAAVGVNVTGTVIVPPAVMALGSAGALAP